MAGANGEEKCIGRLTLDIEDIERKVEKINSLLEGIGSGIKVDLSGAISKEVDKQISDVQKRVETGAKEIETTISNIGSGVSGKIDLSHIVQIDALADKFKEARDLITNFKKEFKQSLSETWHTRDWLNKDAQSYQEEFAKLFNSLHKTFEKSHDVKDALDELYLFATDASSGSNDIFDKWFDKAVALQKEIEYAKGMLQLEHFDLKTETDGDPKVIAAEIEEAMARAKSGVRGVTEEARALAEEEKKVAEEATNVASSANDAFSAAKESASHATASVDEQARATEKVAEAQQNLNNAVSTGSGGGLESTMQKVTTTVNTYVSGIDEAGQATSKFVGSVQTGFDAAGNKIKEFADDTGAITRRTEEIKDSVREQEEAMWRLHDAEQKAYEKQGEAAVKAGLQREEAARKAAQAEADRTSKETATMEADIAKRAAAEEAALEKKIQADAEAQERLRQQSIETEFAREEARKREAEAEEDLIHKEVATMEEALDQRTAAEQAALDKQIKAHEDAEERKRQASINAEFDREEARKRAHQEEMDLVHKEVAAMEEALEKQREAQQKQFETDQINKAKQAYEDLKNAIERYNIAKRTNNAEGMRTSREEIDTQMKVVEGIERAVEASHMEGAAKQEVLNYTERCRVAQEKNNAGLQEGASLTNQMGTQMSSLLTRYLSIMAVIRTINKLISSTVEYVSQYYDKMNEIQIITGDTEVEAERLGKIYRAIAKEMNVSSLDMADAAIYFTRQGLGAAEVEKRLQYTTQYAKAANIEFERSAELITAVVNSMDLVDQEADDGRNAAQRVADVFLKIGDNAATSGEEIGTAMQKAAAAAGAFGVEFEWLAASIGAVSETTRQEATSIGTAFNTLIARLHSIRSVGYNSEDETKINDIQKALNNINVQLLDEQGNWRKMEDIFTEIAQQWDTLDGKTKSYIATTMAGVKQQNVFLALMEDMSQAAEGTSRQQELYNLALDSAGTAQSKYATYTESVAASQERLNIAQEEFYSLVQDDYIKGWYDGLTRIVETITRGTDALGGMNIILPITIGLVGALSKAITVLQKNPMMGFVAAIGASIVALTLLGEHLAASKRKYDEACEAIIKINAEIDKASADKNNLSKMMEDVGDKTAMTKEELEKYSGLLDRLSSISPEAKSAVDNLRNGFGDQRDAVHVLNEEIDKYLENAQNMAAIEMIQKYNNYQSSTPDMQSYQKWDESWYEGLEGKEGFTKALQKAYMTQALDTSPLGANLLSSDTFDEIAKWLEAGVDWDRISTHIWGKIFNGDSSYDVEKATANEINGMIEEVMSLVGRNMNDFDRMSIRERLTGMLFGEDGSLNVANVNEAAKIISGFISTAFDKSFNASEMIGSYGRLFGFAKNILGEMSGDIYQQIFDVSGAASGEQNNEVVDKIAESYMKLVKAGVSKADIQSIYSNTPVDEWMNAYADYVETRAKEVERRIQASTEDWDFNIWDFFGENLENDVDVEVLNLLDALADAEVGIDQIKEATKDATTIDGFKKALRGLAETAGVDLPEGAEGGEESIDNLVKKIKASIKDIQAIDKAIKDISDGKIDSYSDLLGIAESHPEIMTAIDDTKKLAEVLQRLKEEQKELQRTSYKNVILNTEGGTKGTQYEDSGFNTLAEVRESLDSDEAALAEFDQWIEGIAEKWLNANENAKEAEKEAKAASKSLADAMKEAQKEFNDSIKEVEMLDKAIKNLTSGKTVDFSDIINLSTAHPEIVAFADDADRLLEILNKIRDQEKNDVRASIRQIMLKSEDYFKNSGYYDSRFKNMEEYLNALEASGGDWQTVSASVDDAAQNIVDASKETEKAAETWLEAQAKIAKINSEVKWAKANNFVEQIGALERAYERGGGAAALNVWQEYDEEMRKAIANEYPDIITALAEVEQRVNNTNNAYDEQIAKIRQEQTELFKLSNVDLNSRPVIDSRKLGEAGWDGDFQEGDLSTVYSTSYHAGTKEGADMAWNKDVVVTLTPILANGEVMSPEAVEKYLEELFAQSGDISELMANDKAGKGILIDVTAVGDTQSFEEAQEAVNKLMIRLHELQERLYGAKVESADLGTALSNGAKYANFSSNAFEKTGKAIKQLREGTISATDAYDTFTGEVNNVTKAYEEILAYQEKLAYNQKLTAEEIANGKEKAIHASDVDTLAKLIGKTTDEVLADFPAAMAAFDELTGATGELKMMLDELNKAAFIRITGTSEADFSNIQNGLITTQGMADETIKMLEATGQWTVENMKLDQEAWVKEGDVWVKKYFQGMQQVLKPTGNNPFAKNSSVKRQTNTSNNSSKSRGGGGGGSNKNNDFRDKNTNTEVERMLDMMSQVNAIQQSQQNYYQTQQKYYSQGGMIQGVIAYMQREQDVLKNQNVTLEANVKEIERYMAAKRAELSQLSTSDENYKDVADDLDKLQKAHQNYTKQLIDNKTAIEALTQSMDEQRKKIRTMEINLRNLILKAIEDREKKKKDMLNAEIQMENTIFNLIKRRYEVERDEILETNQMRIDALQQEKDLLSQQLQLRKEQAEAEDKAAKLRELEVKYQRILADPTRKKEAQSIKTEIDALRKEMAWDLAENEVKAQQDSIDQQITSLEDYAEYVTNYYEDLFEHPKKLIEEMRNIMVLSQTEIIEWLKANDETYREASENTQLQMVNGWTETYNEMKGILIDYWEEVEEIIAQGDNYIIEFLKNNSSEYAKAGKLQAEAYVEEWMKQLEDLHNAYKSVTADVASDYDTIQQYTGSASNSKSSGGSGRSGSSNKTNTTETPKLTSTAKHGYAVSINGKRYNNQGYESESAAANAAQALISSYLSGARLTGSERDQVSAEAARTLVVYGKGGEADFTGPAWLDGSKELPERILSPYQTQLFNTMVEALERMSRISVMPAPNMGGLETTGANPVSVGDIIVNVENLDTDDDYEELADKVSDVLMDRIGRTAVVGGLRIRTT